MHEDSSRPKRGSVRLSKTRQREILAEVFKVRNPWEYVRKAEPQPAPVYLRYARAHRYFVAGVEVVRTDNRPGGVPKRPKKFNDLGGARAEAKARKDAAFLSAIASVVKDFGYDGDWADTPFKDAKAPAEVVAYWDRRLREHIGGVS